MDNTQNIDEKSVFIVSDPVIDQLKKLDEALVFANALNIVSDNAFHKAKTKIAQLIKKIP
ncbi:MAG: hypothetical protein LBV68_05060 [Spirochaetaceae bacterium]|jgi:hypothetical protein|nr:hypothetical protein [Spirochaetaceae bacterium]